MNNTTYTANENCFLIDGEVYLTDNNKIERYWLYVDKYTRLVDGTVEKNVLPETWYEKLHDMDCYKNVTHSTNKDLDNIVSLPREKFVSHFSDDLMLPTSLEINEQGEIVNVIW